ncbi:MAG: UDP-N-acetylglucosamine--N-acetylmuramyl-(pentapeptide) pyrophosphoryl-undecaprenol N-acetylglucosamine transferase [Planctomycetota bacterium]
MQEPSSGQSETGQRCVLFAGGGSGGHLYPGLAVSTAMRELDPSVRPLFLCTEREIDRVLLEPTGEAFVQQPIVPPTRSVGGLLRFWQAWRATNDLVKKLIDEHQPVAVLGLGGYAAGVAVKLAGRRKLPTGILNPDVVPGKANVYLMPYCRRIYLGHDAASEHVPQEHRDKCLTTGVPLRPGMEQRGDRDAACRRFDLDPRLNTLLVTGASQGAKTINEAIVETARRSTTGGGPFQGWQVLHLAGRDHAETVREAWRTTTMNGRAKVLDFTPDMHDVWSAADLAVSRSGAGTCAEVAAMAVPTVFMPYPFHKDMHQAANAKVLADAGAAVIVDDRKDAAANADALQPVLKGLLYQSERRASMRDAAEKVAKRDAAMRVAKDLLDLTGVA